MRHGWLALVVLVAVAGEAHAFKPLRCYCRARVVRPEPTAGTLLYVDNQGGARTPRHTPANSKTWVVDPSSGGIHTPTRVPTPDVFGVRVLSPTLMPDQLYHDRHRDDDAPATPSTAYVSIVTNGLAAYSHVESLTVNGTFADDTEWIRVDIKDADGYVSLLLHRNGLDVCDPGFKLASHRVDVELRAIDLAGNESAPFVTTIDTISTFSTKPRFDCSGSAGQWLYGHRGHGYEILGLLFLWFVVVVAWVVIAGVRRLTAKRSPAEPVAHLEAEEVVRRMSRWLVVWSAMLIATMIGLHSLGKEQTTIYAFCLFPFAFSALVRLWIARRARSLLDKPEADAVRHGRWLCVTTLRDSVLLRAEDIDFVVAKRRSIPRSVVK